MRADLSISVTVWWRETDNKLFQKNFYPYFTLPCNHLNGLHQPCILKSIRASRYLV